MCRKSTGDGSCLDNTPVPTASQSKVPDELSGPPADSVPDKDSTAPPENVDGASGNQYLADPKFLQALKFGEYNFRFLTETRVYIS